LEQRLTELPREQEIVAYCRGPYWVLSFEAVADLHARIQRASVPKRFSRVEGRWLARRVYSLIVRTADRSLRPSRLH